MDKDGIKNIVMLEFLKEDSPKDIVALASICASEGVVSLDEPDEADEFCTYIGEEFRYITTEADPVSLVYLKHEPYPGEKK